MNNLQNVFNNLNKHNDNHYKIMIARSFVGDEIQAVSKEGAVLSSVDIVELQDEEKTAFDFINKFVSILQVELKDIDFFIGDERNYRFKFNDENMVKHLDFREYDGQEQIEEILNEIVKQR